MITRALKTPSRSIRETFADEWGILNTDIFSYIRRKDLIKLQVVKN